MRTLWGLKKTKTIEWTGLGGGLSYNAGNIEVWHGVGDGRVFASTGATIFLAFTRYSTHVDVGSNVISSGPTWESRSFEGI